MKPAWILCLTLGLAPVAQAGDWSADAMRGPYPDQAFDRWSGLYAGGHMGYGWGGASNDFWDPAIPAWEQDGDIDYESLTGGLHIGAQQQLGGFLAGIEADFSLSRYRGDDAQVAGRINEIAINSMATLRGRLGWAADNLLFYGTAGIALAQFEKTDRNGGVPGPVQLAGGWTAGGGVEMALDGNWAIRAEYLHTRLNDVETGVNVNDPLWGIGTYSHRANAPAINLLRVGASYRF